MTDHHPGTGGHTSRGLSQQAHRRLIGYLGLLLPGLLYVLAGLRPTAQLPPWHVLRSVSAYYYTGAVSVFVGVIFALALFLLTYPGYEHVIADRVVGIVGGVAALLVALCPAGPPDGLRAPTWWREELGVVHTASAVVLFICFILFAIWLFRRSDIPKRRDRPLGKRWRDDLCLACGLVMIVGVLWATSSLVTKAPIFLPESVAIVFFAISWLVKGEAHVPVVKAVRAIRRRRGRGAPTG